MVGCRARLTAEGSERPGRARLAGPRHGGRKPSARYKRAFASTGQGRRFRIESARLCDVRNARVRLRPCAQAAAFPHVVDLSKTRLPAW